MQSINYKDRAKHIYQLLVCATSTYLSAINIFFKNNLIIERKVIYEVYKLSAKNLLICYSSLILTALHVFKLLIENKNRYNGNQNERNLYENCKS